MTYASPLYITRTQGDNMRLYIFLIATALVIQGFSVMFEELSTVQPNVTKIYNDMHGVAQ